MVYDPNAKPENPYARVYESFLEETKDHVLTVRLDAGLHRHMRVGAPDTGMWSWNIVTWPGHLATAGDIADGFIFNRLTDMLEFFDVRFSSRDYYTDGSPSIDFRYWAQKLNGGRSHDVKTFSSEMFLSTIKDLLEENEELGTEAQEEYEKIVAVAKRVCRRARFNYTKYLEALRANGSDSGLEPKDDDSEAWEYFGEPIPEQSPAERRAEILDEARRHADSDHEAHEWLAEDEQTEIFGEDHWEHDFRDYDFHFVMTCYCIDLSVRLWREYEKKNAQALSLDLGPKLFDDYVLVEGGLVQNSPVLPVYDTDVLKSDVPDKDSAREALRLYEDISAHPRAAIEQRATLQRAAEFVLAYGNEHDIRKMEVHERNRADAALNSVALPHGRDGYVFVDGGLVQNDPVLPVLDTDVLDSDAPDEKSAREALRLYNRIMAHPRARVELPVTIQKAAEFVLSYGSPDDIAKMEENETARHKAEAETATKNGA